MNAPGAAFPLPPEPSVQLSPPQMIAARACLDAGAREAAQRAPLRAASLRPEIGELAICPLSDFPARAVSVDHPQLVAAAVAGLRGPLSLTALVAFEPRDALALLRRLSGGIGALGHAELARFVEAGGALIEGAVRALARAADGELSPARLVEDSLVGAVLGTHAPPDASVLSARLELALPERTLHGALYVIVEEKLLPALLEALSPPASAVATRSA